MSEKDLAFCDKCFQSIGEYGTLRCGGLDTEFQIPLVNLYHRECYATLSEQEDLPICTSCVDNPCFIRKKQA